MSKNENEVNVLDELNKGASMGKDAIHFIMDKVKDENLRIELDNQYKKYDEITQKIARLYPEYSEKQPHDTSVLNKARTWYGIEMKTMMDESTSKIAELLLQGTNMGIIEGRKLLNHKNSNEEVNSIAQEYVNMQENAVEQLKKFL